jgi:site-specific DNA recombinase
MSDIQFFDAFAKGTKKVKSVTGKDCVIYTRVSSKDQTENLSLATQLKACTNYAEKLGYNIMATFGGTYESAETDERKQFVEMITFVKKYKGRIAHILVYSLERFSRNDNSIWLTNQLRKLGTEIVSVTQPIDTSNASGQMQQKLLFLFGEFDNQLRKQKCSAGIKECLLRGEWPTKPPLGYERVSGNRRKIIINAKGKLIRQAFEWKAFENVANEVIRERLAERGLKMNHQRVSETFRNPFYCGLMAHKMLEGKVVEGNYEPIVSKNIFLKVNGLLDQYARGYTINEENAEIPLKRFAFCASCGQPLRGYITRKKNIYYYKCNTKACCNNKNANQLNGMFANILDYFKIDIAKGALSLLREQMLASFNQLSVGKRDAKDELMRQFQELSGKVNRLEERYIEEQIGDELYQKYRAKYLEERAEIEGNLMKLSGQLSNLEKVVDATLKFCVELPKKWLFADYHTKQQLQQLVFPSGITYDKKNNNCRTSRINSVFLYLAYFQQVVGKKKSGIPDLGLDYSAFASLVAGSRIELPTSGL